MNENINFWRVWSRNEKITAIIISGIIGLSLLVLSYIFISGQNLTVKWSTQTELHEKLESIPSYFYGDMVFSSTQPVWYVKEKYLPAINSPSSWFFENVLFLTFIGLSFILATLQKLKGYWFPVGALILGGALISFRLENVFQTHSQWPFLLAFIIGGFIYFVCNVFQAKISLTRSIIIWVLFWFIFYFVCKYYGIINQPLASITAHSMIFLLIIFAIFVFMSSHETLAGMIWLVSKNARKGENSLKQYLLISTILLLNALLVFFENSNKIEESFYIFPPVFWFILNGALGIWGFRKFCEQMNWFSHRQSGFWLYSGFFLISIAALVLIYGSANDSLIELTDDYISISFLALSLGFFVYVLINYYQLFKDGLDVHKVLYKSPFNRLVFSRTAAFFLILLLFSFKNYHSYFQLQSGISNTIADFYRIEGDLKAAETYYKNSTHYELNNQKASLSLASMSVELNDPINASFFFNQALQKASTPHAYVGLANNLEATDMYFDAIFTLQKGLKKFPNSAEIYTNLASLQAKANITDSVLINLVEAAKHCKDCGTENGNLLAFWIENSKPEKLQEMSEGTKKSDYKSFWANKSAINRILNLDLPSNTITIPKDSALDMATAAWVLNNALYTRKTENQNFVSGSDLNAIQKKEANQSIFEELSLAYAFQNFFRENKVTGLKQLTLLSSSNSKYKNIYNQIAGLWYMQEGLSQKAAKMLSFAGDSTSAKKIQNPDISQKIDSTLRNQANKLTVDLSLKNYEQVLSKAPLNPYLIEKMANFLVKNNKKSEAYSLVFYATELNEDSPMLWEKYIDLALGLSEYEYALEGLEKLKPLVPKTKITTLNQKIINQKNTSQSDYF